MQKKKTSTLEFQNHGSAYFVIEQVRNMTCFNLIFLALDFSGFIFQSEE